MNISEMMADSDVTEATIDCCALPQPTPKRKAIPEPEIQWNDIAKTHTNLYTNGDYSLYGAEHDPRCYHGYSDM